MVQIRAGDMAMAALYRVGDLDRSYRDCAVGMHLQKDGGGKAGGGGKSSS